MRNAGFDEQGFGVCDTSCWHEYVSTVDAAKMLGVSKMELCNILNLGAIETNQEEKRQAAFKLFQQEMPGYEEFKYFNFDKLGVVKVHAMSLLNYAKKHGISFDLKVDGVRMRYAHEHASKDQLFNINVELQKN